MVKGAHMRWGKKIATGALAVLMGATATGLATAAPAEAAGAKYKCSISKAGLDWGRPSVTSSCKKSSSGKKVSKHRAMLKCDVVRGAGAGAEHTIRYTEYGPWVSPGKKSSVKCGFRSFTAGFGVQTKR